MRKILGILIILLGIILGIYVGGYLLLFCGIIQIINNINPINAVQIAIGVIRIMFCELGYIIFAFFFAIGDALFKSSYWR